MSELSPAAQAVLDAFVSNAGEGHRHQSGAAAAALRAAADQVVPEESPLSGGMRPGGTGALTLDEAQMFQRVSTRRRILAIATELENQ